MHYYKFNIADYRKDTNHLSRLEHAIYRELIDLYYLEEKPIPKETHWVTRRLRLDTEEETKAFNNVIRDFFEQTETHWTHPRIEAEIQAYHENAEKNRSNGKRGGRPKNQEKQQVVESGEENKPNGFPVASHPEPNGNPNHKPLTTNHKPFKSMSPQADDAQVVFDYWCYRMGKNASAKFSAKRRKAVADRFKDGRTVEQIKQAIDGCAKSPFHMGQGPDSKGTVFDDLDLICRNNEKFEHFLGLNQRMDSPKQQKSLDQMAKEDPFSDGYEPDNQPHDGAIESHVPRLASGH